MKNNAHFPFAQWLHGELQKRRMSPRRFAQLLDDEVPMWTIWRWLRGEFEPKGWQLAKIMERFQVFIQPEVLKASDCDGMEIKAYPQTYFPGMGPRKKAVR